MKKNPFFHKMKSYLLGIKFGEISSQKKERKKKKKKKKKKHGSQNSLLLPGQLRH
jgi:hypothetical protein